MFHQGRADVGACFTSEQGGKQTYFLNFLDICLCFPRGNCPLRDHLSGPQELPQPSMARMLAPRDPPFLCQACATCALAAIALAGLRGPGTLIPSWSGGGRSAEGLSCCRVAWVSSASQQGPGAHWAQALHGSPDRGCSSGPPELSEYSACFQEPEPEPLWCGREVGSEWPTDEA